MTRSLFFHQFLQAHLTVSMQTWQNLSGSLNCSIQTAQVKRSVTSSGTALAIVSPKKEGQKGIYKSKLLW